MFKIITETKTGKEISFELIESLTGDANWVKINGGELISLIEFCAIAYALYSICEDDYKKEGD